MRATDNSTLAKAIESLGAVEVAPGFYALKGGVSKIWRVLGLARVAPGFKVTPLSFAVSGAKMPPWWSPSQRETTRVVTDDGAVSYLDAEPWTTDMESLYPHATFTRITADLTTGEEVPA